MPSHLRTPDVILKHLIGKIHHLLRCAVDLLPGDYYRFMDVVDPDLKLILDAFQIKIPLDLYRRADLKAIKTSTKIFI